MPTKKQDEVWSVDALKEFFLAQFAELEKRLDDRFNTAEKTTENTRQAMERQLDRITEDQATKFVTKDSLDTKINNLCEKIDTLKIINAEKKGANAQLQLTWGQLTTYIIVGTAVVTLILKVFKIF
jgi:phosphoenolpyruvate carboxylase